jgi:putative transposase
MRYPASEKVEIIRLVEQSHLSVRRTLEQIGVSRATFYRWYDRYQTGGPEALEDRPSRPSRVWNRVPDDTRQQILALALRRPSYHPVSWRCASPTRPGISYRKQRSTACSKPTI